jgi:alkanesulfonate monooxygenase SsuD/methylene tetrahydromethanopterin reductase-like flavin-dependent oxidoreductase (luciferase family)
MAERMRFGVQALTYGAEWSDAIDVAKRIDRLGYDYLFGHDHLFSTGGDPRQKFFEGWLTVAAWAQATDRVKVGITVGNNTFRNPGVVAKMAATIDHISGGRSILGLGAGNVELEAVAHGLPWASVGTRLDWFDESLTLIRRVLAGDEVTHDGPTYHFDHVRQNPLPLQQPLPVIIGAEGEKKGLRLAAKHADIWQIFMGMDDVDGWRRKDEIFRAHGADLGRDVSGVERMIGCKLLIRSTEAEARRAAEEFIAIHKWGEGIWDAFWATTPARVADALSAFAEAGVQSFTPQIGWPYDVETLEAVIGPVAEQVASVGARA